ncbi:hypothetical protein [Lacticaseibacillus brantae]|uniref:hypothetical protein n=1 Tax=Lacticaseibacillus brantae TaxID=943673 RepID=UPI00070F6061|nr:hypothetical protein [Lacticaseibacillus brantae]
MRNSLVYVHFEPFAHLFLTYGIATSDIIQDQVQVPQHILLLPPIDEDEFVDPHTGFNVISGQEAVRDFMQSRLASQRDWLDYSHGTYLQELTPGEIAELLYLGHAKTHMQSPFYYKLQNNLVVLPLSTGLINMYFRHLNTFDTTLSAALLRHVRWAANEQPFWLRLRQQEFPAIDPATLKAIRERSVDGIIFNFSGVAFSREAVRVQLLQPTGRFLPERELGNQTIGALVLDRQKQQWTLQLDGD